MTEAISSILGATIHGEITRLSWPLVGLFEYQKCIVRPRIRKTVTHLSRPTNQARRRVGLTSPMCIRQVSQNANLGKPGQFQTQNDGSGPPSRRRINRIHRRKSAGKNSVMRAIGLYPNINSAMRLLCYFGE